MTFNELKYMFLLGCVLLTACKGEGLPLPPSGDNQEIGFSTQIKETRAPADFIDNDTFQKKGKFILYSNYDNDRDGKSTPEFQHQLITYDKDKNKWTYEPKKYWRGTGIYHFRACFPDTTRIVPSSSGENLAIEYSIYKDRYDLMVAHHKRDVDNEKAQGIDTSRPVSMVFNHALSAIKLKMTCAKEERFRLYNIYAMNLHTVGLLSYRQDIESSEINDAEGNSRLITDWELVRPDQHNHLYLYEPENQFVTFNTPFESAFLFVLPQKIDPDKDHAPKLCFTIGTGTNGEDKVYTEKILPATTWYPGKKYTYLLKIEPDLTTSIKVIVKDWEEIASVGDDIVVF